MKEDKLMRLNHQNEENGEGLTKFTGEDLLVDLKVSMTKIPFMLRVYAKIDEAKALKSLRPAHIKIIWVSYRVRMKTEATCNVEVLIRQGGAADLASIFRSL